MTYSHVSMDATSSSSRTLGVRECKIGVSRSWKQIWTPTTSWCARENRNCGGRSFILGPAHLAKADVSMIYEPIEIFFGPLEWRTVNHLFVTPMVRSYSKKPGFIPVGLHETVSTILMNVP